jgi:hypothetical protein
MTSAATNIVIAIVLAASGVAIAATGIYVGETDDAPGASLAGILLMVGALVLAVRKLRRRS